MSGVSKCRVVCVGGREGAWWLPAGGICASQGTFSSLIQFYVPFKIISAHISGWYENGRLTRKNHLANRKQKVSHRDQRDPTFTDTIHTK